MQIILTGWSLLLVIALAIVGGYFYFTWIRQVREREQWLRMQKGDF